MSWAIGSWWGDLLLGMWRFHGEHPVSPRASVFVELRPEPNIAEGW